MVQIIHLAGSIQEKFRLRVQSTDWLTQKSLESTFTSSLESNSEFELPFKIPKVQRNSRWFEAIHLAGSLVIKVEVQILALSLSSNLMI